MATLKDTASKVSRRSFLRKTATGAGATAAMVAAGHAAEAAQGASAGASITASSITIPAEFAAAATAPPKKMEFPLSGAEVFARACQQEGVAALFCCPGNYTVIHAIASAGIPAYGGRHEGSMAHAA